jgi:hypothetical protein
LARFVVDVVEDGAAAVERVRELVNGWTAADA